MHTSSLCGTSQHGSALRKALSQRVHTHGLTDRQRQEPLRNRYLRSGDLSALQEAYTFYAAVQNR
jgi:hypothetical protein